LSPHMIGAAPQGRRKDRPGSCHGFFRRITMAAWNSAFFPVPAAERFCRLPDPRSPKRSCAVLNADLSFHRPTLRRR